MPVITVIYPASEQATFDFSYYEETHLPLVAEKWGHAGLTGAEALRGHSTPDRRDPPFIAIAVIRFGSMEDFQAAMQGEGAAAILGDIPNFTNIQPIVQINEQIG